jgi:hypothetical protein
MRQSPAPFAISFALAVLVACSGDPSPVPADGGGIDANADSADGGGADATAEIDGAVVDQSDALFRPDHVLEIHITLDAADWERLRNEPEQLGMPHATCSHQPTETAYHHYPGSISIDGVVTSNVGVRKKGNLGSSTSARPSLKIKAHEYVDGQRISGLRQLTLNNNNQDPTRISQCLGYGLFREAGVPASRCSFAHVTVNGEDQGVYSNVETIKESFLERHFEDGAGRLYESGGDFVPGATDGFQPKTDEESPDCSDLPPVATALQSPNGGLLQALDAVVDVDAFMTYWAMEVITDHWDGYANNLNNFFLYHDPTSDKFHFIPWGIDALFTGSPRTTRPMSVFACGSLPWRLYDVPETRDLYLARIRELLDTVWDEDAILAEIARMQDLIEPLADPASDGELAAAIDRTRDFVRTRTGVLLTELEAGTPAWPYPAGEASCRILLGTVTASFDTSWDSLDVWDAGTGTMDGTVAGVSLASSTAYTSAGPAEGSTAVIQVTAALADGRFGVVFILLQGSVAIEPGQMSIDLVNVAAIMTFFDPVTDTSSGGGLLLSGSLTLSEASTVRDAPIVGTITGEVLEL